MSVHEFPLDVQPLSNASWSLDIRRSVFETESGYIRRRRLDFYTPIRINMVWDLDHPQYVVFDDWFYNTIRCGSEPFDIRLNLDGLDLWYTVTVPLGKYVASCDSVNNWRVSITLQAVDPPTPERTI